MCLNTYECIMMCYKCMHRSLNTWLSWEKVTEECWEMLQKVQLVIL